MQRKTIDLSKNRLFWKIKNRLFWKIKNSSESVVCWLEFLFHCFCVGKSKLEGQRNRIDGKNSVAENILEKEERNN